jgi:Uroporphyrinogen-III synthase
MLEEQGAEAFLYSSIKTIPPVDWGPLDQSLEELSSYDGLIFTSANGVHFFSKRLREKTKISENLKEFAFMQLVLKQNKPSSN